MLLVKRLRLLRIYFEIHSFTLGGEKAVVFNNFLSNFWLLVKRFRLLKIYFEIRPLHYWVKKLSSLITSCQIFVISKTVQTFKNIFWNPSFTLLSKKASVFNNFLSNFWLLVKRFRLVKIYFEIRCLWSGKKAVVFNNFKYFLALIKRFRLLLF